MSVLTVTGTYAGELALPYIHAALLSGDTIANRYVTVKENVKFKAVLKRLSSTNLVQAHSCNFGVGSSTLTLDEQVLTVTDLKTNLEVCKDQFASDWEAMQTGRGFINDVIPANFADFLLTYLAAKISEQIEFNLWVGNFSASFGGASGYTAFDGLLTKIAAAKGTPDYDITAALTAGNIMTAIDALVPLIPAAIVGSPQTKCYMSRKTFALYMQACMNGITAGGALVPSFDAIAKQVYGYEIYVCPGFSNNVIMFAQPENLFVGTDLISDQNEVKVVDMSLTDGSDNVRMAMRYRFGTQFGFIGDIAIAY